jgi:hypothetical protein
VAQLDAPPGALLVPLIDGRPGGQAFRVRGRKPAAQLSRWIAAIEADTPTKETR